MSPQPAITKYNINSSSNRKQISTAKNIEEDQIIKEEIDQSSPMSKQIKDKFRKAIFGDNPNMMDHDIDTADKFKKFMT